MRDLKVIIRMYDCHPETCAHFEHYAYWVQEDGWQWVEGFDTREEAESFMEQINA